MNQKQEKPTKLFDTVVSGGYCIGCGACAAFDSNIRIRLNEFGQYQATRSLDSTTINPPAERVCPFADGVPDEDGISREVFGEDTTLDPQLGHVLATYAGWVSESDYRASGSSGGLASWVLVELLNRGLVDQVVHVIPQSVEQAGEPLFKFSVSSTPQEVRSGAKSRYYPVEMSGVIRQMLDNPGRYAVVGIPCFIKSIRLACRESEILRDRVRFTVAIFCGHLKSTAFAELFAWQCGINPSEIRGIDFRTKLSDRPASSYGITAHGQRNGERVVCTRPTSELYGSNWGHGFFKYKACDFCDDVVGETADISVGDAWLPEYVNDSAGTNVMVVRSIVIHSILAEAKSAGRLEIEAITSDKAVESQAGGFRHRRDGLAFRLWMEDQAGRWRPNKRVAPSSSHLSAKQQAIYRTRQEIAEVSHIEFRKAKSNGRLDTFLSSMRFLTSRYDHFYRPPLHCRLIGKLKSFIRKFLL